MASDAEKLLVRFRQVDSHLGVTRDTLRSISASLGVDETSVIHLALVQLADKVLPRYERDSGPLSAAQLKEARSLVSQDREPTSSLFGTTARKRRAAKKAAP